MTISDEMVERAAIAYEKAFHEHADTREGYRDMMRDALTAALQGSVVVPAQALLWLTGEAPDADGKWFGECEDEVIKTPRKYTRAYWWRSKFRSMVPNWPTVTRHELCGEVSAPASPDASAPARSPRG
jgi:hypothetical protein